MICRKVPGMRSVAVGAPAPGGVCCEKADAPTKNNRNALSTDFGIATPFSTGPWADYPRSRSVLFPAARHFEPVQFLLDLMKGVIADLVARPHREHRAAR